MVNTDDDNQWMLISNQSCITCNLAKNILESNNQFYNVLYKNDLEKEEYENLKKDHLYPTLPIIYLNNKYFGGYIDLVMYFEEKGKIPNCPIPKNNVTN